MVAYTYTGADCNADADTDKAAETYSDTDADGNTYTDADGNAYAYADTDSNAYADDCAGVCGTGDPYYFSGILCAGQLYQRVVPCNV